MQSKYKIEIFSTEGLYVVTIKEYVGINVRQQRKSNECKSYEDCLMAIRTLSAEMRVSL